MEPLYVHIYHHKALAQKVRKLETNLKPLWEYRTIGKIVNCANCISENIHIQILLSSLSILRLWQNIGKCFFWSNPLYAYIYAIPKFVCLNTYSEVTEYAIDCYIYNCWFGYFLEVKLSYDPSCPSVGWLVGRLVGLSVIVSCFNSHAPVGAIFS